MSPGVREAPGLHTALAREKVLTASSKYHQQVFLSQCYLSTPQGTAQPLDGHSWAVWRGTVSPAR